MDSSHSQNKPQQTVAEELAQVELEAIARKKTDGSDGATRAFLQAEVSVEIALSKAKAAVQILGEHYWLEDAVTLLDQARKRVADYKDFKKRYPPLDIQ